MADFKMHLASELVAEQKTVSYRSLARSQKVHVNSAKCMLYEFYQEQIKRKPGSVYATYLMSGVKRKEKPTADPDVSMRSSPPPSSSMPQSQSEEEEIKVKTIALVREEDLEGMCGV
jgi:DNA polymerase delta subunit 3